MALLEVGTDGPCGKRFSLFLVGMAALCVYLWHYQSSRATAIFKVGQCVQFIKRERWDTVQPVRIEEIGVDSYRISYCMQNKCGWDKSSFNFNLNPHLIVVPCPSQE